ncbi:uncharacterized protein KGF55_001063 [Candida pseudojiufengensis]|uniref:uncharacterized protein n=1 Tax=Candida pseudojiufengensis TaxID=497109 RepID=UPI002223EEBE|nr:uncharacterized protein KGF55_001063 [Candida pseudojiufengensis]KAI5965701.1 hypothetical protein KGF55_001063 [Candida pseudojiufengensis]
MSLTSLPIQTFEEYDPSVPLVLPHEKVYSMQVGYKLFRLSGLSLSSDSPSYFTKFFNDPENEDKILFFDRDPKIFEKIYNHLQGYSINITNDYEFMHLWSDAFYFGLKNLKKVLTEQDIFASIGEQCFKIPRSLLINEGNAQNYFTVNSDRLLFDNLAIIEKKNMLRPPPQRPAIVTNRSPKLFADLLEFLKGNTLIIKNEEHRNLLLKEARYYRFLELEQKMICHKIINNQIILNVEDIAKRGILNISPLDKSREVSIKYSRPYINETPKDLVIQIKNDNNLQHSRLIINRKLNIITAKFEGKIAQKLKQIFKDVDALIVNEFSISFLVSISRSKTVLDGSEMSRGWINDFLNNTEEAKDGEEPNSKKRKVDNINSIQGEIIEIFLKKSLWKIMMRGKLARLEAVSLEGQTGPQLNDIDFI